MSIFSPRTKGGRFPDRVVPRAVIELRLTGGPHGAISLGDLSGIAKHTQDVVRSLTRSLGGEKGPGRSSSFVARASELVATTVRSGSPVLEIVAPAWSDELDIPTDDVGFDVGVQAIDLVTEAIQAVGSAQPLSDRFTDQARDHLRALLAAASRFDRLDWDVTHHGQTKQVSVRPDGATVPPLVPQSVEPETVVVIGELYALNSHRGTYTVEDDLGYSIRCHVTPESELASDLNRLVGGRVGITGLATRDRSGRVSSVVGSRVESVSQQGDEYWSFDAAAALRPAQPIDDLDSLAIPGLTEEEAAAFREDLRRR